MMLTVKKQATWPSAQLVWYIVYHPFILSSLYLLCVSFHSFISLLIMCVLSSFHLFDYYVYPSILSYLHLFTCYVYPIPFILSYFHLFTCYVYPPSFHTFKPFLIYVLRVLLYTFILSSLYFLCLSYHPFIYTFSYLRITCILLLSSFHTFSRVSYSFHLFIPFHVYPIPFIHFSF